MRLQEVHPALVHFPLAFIPLSIGADLIGRITGSDALMNLGKRTMPLAVASGLVAGAAGLMAQSQVEAEGVALDQLKTHRTLNLGLVTAAAAMSAYRARTEKPGLGYLLAGVAALVALDYSAYLGGAMVYQHGLGVEAAGGVRTDPPVPELTPGSAGDAARTAWSDLERGIRTTVEESAKGDLVPALLERGGDDASAAAG